MSARVGLLLAAFMVITGITASSEAQGEGERYALVVGNSAYRHGSPLRNPANDARAVANALRSIGYQFGDVGGALLDADKATMEAALRDFRQRTTGAEQAFFFYAGHGIQFNSRNYLLPVDARLQDPADIGLETVDVGDVLGQMRAGVNLIVLDACRENPFEEQLRLATEGLGRSWSGGRGFSRIDPGTMRGGSLLAMAAAPGAIADDGGSAQNSPYTSALLRHLVTPGLNVRLLFAKVREEVESATGLDQRPEAVDRLPSRPVFLVPTAATPQSALSVPTAPPAVATQPAFDVDMMSCNALQSSRSAAAFQAYLDQFPNGACAPFARIKLAELGANEAPRPVQTAAVPTPPEPTVSPEGEERGLGLSLGVWRNVQAALNRLGHAAGQPDGRPGPRTRSAIESWQRSAGLPATGYLSRDAVQQIISAAASLRPPSAPAPSSQPGQEGRPSVASIRWGDDASEWAKDGECDDPRFAGAGVHSTLLESDRFHDATDCRSLYQQGRIDLRPGVSPDAGPRTTVPPQPSAPASIQWGDNASKWANDGECDDPRFMGAGMHSVLLDEDRMHDANDCRTLYQQGRIRLRPEASSGAAAQSATPASAPSSRSIQWGDNASQWANDGECDDPRFTGGGMHSILLEQDRMHDANDCRTLFEQGQIRLK